MSSTASSRASLVTLVSLCLVALVALVSLAGCGTKAAPAQVPAAPQPATATAPAAPSQPATTPAASQQPTVDAAGGAISTTLTLDAGSKQPAKGGIAKPATAVAEKNAIRVLLADDNVSQGAVATVKAMTQDKAGHWWVLLDVTDEGTPGQAVVSFDGKKWEDVVYGEKVTDSDLPPDVRF